MKKSVLLIFVLFAMSFVSAVNVPELQLQNNKEVFQKGETLFGIIEGNFAEKINLEDILFYQGRKNVFIEKDIVYYNGSYYFYAYLNNIGNYTIKIKDILYKDVNDVLNSKTIEKNVSVQKREEVIGNKSVFMSLGIRPGFIYTSKNSSEIRIVNNGNSKLNFSYDYGGGSSEIELGSGDYEKVAIKGLLSGVSFFKVTSYEEFFVPIININLLNLSGENNTLDPSIETDLRAAPDSLKVYVNTSTELNQTIELFNFGDDNLSITFISNSSIIKIIGENEISAREVLNVTFIFYSEREGLFKENITINYFSIKNNESKSLIFPVMIYILGENTSIEDIPSEDSKTCAELSGIICGEDEYCGGETRFASDGYCCLDVCKKYDNSGGGDGSYGWLIGLLIILGLGVGGYFAYKKYKKTKPKKAEEVMKDTASNYEKRVKPVRVHGTLDRN